MIYEPTDIEADPAEAQRRVDAIVAQGPAGAFALAGAGAAIVVALWLAFYVLVFVARATAGE
jgi:hypothetical protein